MAQGAGVEGREVRRGADTAGDDEFGAMESLAGEGEGQGLSPPVVRALDASLHASQFTQEQWGLLEEELQRRLAPMQQQSERDRQQMLGFQASNHALATELTAMHALDQGPRDLFPHDEWEDHRDFEAGAVIARRGPAAGSYTEMRVDGRPSNVSFPAASAALPTRRLVGQLGAASSAPTPRAYMRGRGGFRSSWDGQPPFDPRRTSGQGGAPTYLPTYDARAQERPRHTPGPRYTMREQSAAPIDVAVDQNATLFAKLSQAQQYVQQRIDHEGNAFLQAYSKDEKHLTPKLMGAQFSQAPFQRGANANLRTALRQMFDWLSASNGLAPDRDHYILLMMGAKFAGAAAKEFDRAYLTAMKAFPGQRIRVLFEILLAAYTDPFMPKLLKENKKQALLAWKAATPISVIRESILSLMHEWQQAAEDTADAEGLQKIDEMTEKQWMEECERHWPPWAAALYLTEQHQFGGTVADMFNFLQSREAATGRILQLAVPDNTYTGMTVEEALQYGENEQLHHLLALSRNVRCFRCLQNHYMADCKAAQSREEAAGQARPWPPMPPHPSQLTAVAQLATPQAPPLLPPVATALTPAPVDTALFVAIQEMRADLQAMRSDMQTQQLALQDHAHHQQQMASALLTLTSNLNGLGFSK
jgi:hypothetical protein